MTRADAPQAPTVVSLFSGIGGLDLGLQRAGFRHLLLCESEPWRRDVLHARFPGVPIADDVVRLGEPAGRGAVDPVRPAVDDGRREAGPGLPDGADLLCGGFPCQDLSVAGRRAGLDGSRSGLFFEFARIAESLRPRWLLVENVPGLLSSQGGRDFGVVLGTLADLGYGLAWRILDSRFFGVPQRRRRVFVVGAVADGDPRAAAERAGQVLAVGTRCGRHPATRGEAGPDVAVASLSGLGTGGPDDNDGQGGPTGSVAVALYQESEYGIARYDEAGSLRAGRIPEHQMLTSGASVRRLMPVECCRLQAIPDDWFDGVPGTSDSKMYAGLGDAVTATVGEWIGRRIVDAP